MQTANCKLQTAYCKLHTAYCILQTANYTLTQKCRASGNFLRSSRTFFCHLFEHSKCAKRQSAPKQLAHTSGGNQASRAAIALRISGTLRQKSTAKKKENGRQGTYSPSRSCFIPSFDRLWKIRFASSCFSNCARTYVTGHTVPLTNEIGLQAFNRGYLSNQVSKSTEICFSLLVYAQVRHFDSARRLSKFTSGEVHRLYLKIKETNTHGFVQHKKST